jgi:tight adherence protein C
MTPDLLFAMAAVFVAVALLTGALVATVAGRYSPARRRLEGVAGGSSATPGVTQGPLTLEDVDPVLARATRFIPKSPKQMNRLQRRLMRAGYRGALPTVLYTMSELLLPLALGAIPIYFLGLRQGGILGFLVGVIGYLLPSFWLSRKTELRKKQISNGLPDALDLLIVCVEAGLGLDQAIAKASEELALSHPALAEELRTITTEMRAGKPRLEAFKNFAERTKVDDVRALVSMLVQTDRFGTSIAQALRTQAEVSRTKRRQRAEERAQKLGVKLVFPLVFCLFPAMYVVTLGPAIIKFVRFFGGR